MFKKIFSGEETFDTFTINEVRYTNKQFYDTMLQTFSITNKDFDLEQTFSMYRDMFEETKSKAKNLGINLPSFSKTVVDPVKQKLLRFGSIFKNKLSAIKEKVQNNELSEEVSEEIDLTDAEEKLEELNGYETIKYLLDIFSIGNSPKPVDCTKGLIFVLGNLDEAYTMSNDFNPDMDADEFHEQSMKINVPIIKKALKRRFRNEQIARLGNIHIIYPAFNKKSFQGIIELELSKITEKVNRHQKIKLEFDQTIHDLIYREGVYPTQGTRPIFTTIHQIISTKLGRVITEMILKNLAATNILFKTKDNSITASYIEQQYLRQTFNIFPNPTSDNSTISFSLESSNNVTIQVYDSRGQLIETVIENKPYDLGEHTLEHNTSNIPAGVYLYTIITDKGFNALKLIISK